MIRFFQAAAPRVRDILLIESGSQVIFRRGLDTIRRSFPEARLHLLTCWPDPPPGPFASLHRVRDYASRRDKLRLLRSFRKQTTDILAILCSKEPVMFSWKMLALLLIPAKALIINEHGDYFWFDWQNRRAIRLFLHSRWGIFHQEIFLTFLRALAFPLTVLYLLANATWLYARRWRRLLIWKIRGGGPGRERTRPLW